MAEGEENNEKPQEEPKEEQKEEEEGDSSSALETAQKLYEKIKAENDRHETLLKREERLRAEEIFSGRSSAGQKQPKPKELTPEEYKNKVMAGITP